ATGAGGPLRTRFDHRRTDGWSRARRSRPTMGDPGGVRDAQSTSMAWRPPYQPQLPHTTWGCFTALQRGHRLREGTLSVQLDARRLRLLALEVFFLGTAIVGLSRVDYRGFAWPPAGTFR